MEAHDGHFDLFGKNIKIIQNNYWEQTARVQLEKEMNQNTKIEA